MSANLFSGEASSGIKSSIIEIENNFFNSDGTFSPVYSFKNVLFSLSTTLYIKYLVSGLL